MMRHLDYRPARRCVAVIACLLALGWASSSSAAETTCRLAGTVTFDAGKTTCISARTNWLVCTDASALTGGGVWKDTGVPCKGPPPNSPADYRPVAEGPHPAAPPVAVKRVIDMFHGIAFRCLPSTHLSWSAGACAQITAEFVADAKAAGITVAVIDPADDAAAKAKKTEAAGFKLDEAIDWTVLLRATDPDGAVFSQEINGVMEIVPGIYDWKSLLVVSDAYLHPPTAEHALVEAKGDFAGDLKYLTEP